MISTVRPDLILCFLISNIKISNIIQDKCERRWGGDWGVT